MENISTTRIADLPTSGTTMGMGMGTEPSYMVQQGQQNQQNQQQQGIPPTISITQTKTNQLDSQGLNYMPINVHPNPYGPQTTPLQQPMTPPQSTQQINQQQQLQSQYAPPQYQEELSHLPQQRLPSRDIPMNTTTFTQDEEVQPSYIPQQKYYQAGKDYVRDYETTTEKNIREYERSKKEGAFWDTLMNDLQFPIFIALLFFVFQLPIVNTLLYKNLSFMGLFKEDGNINLNGMIGKSVMFGLSVYGIRALLE